MDDDPDGVGENRIVAAIVWIGGKTLFCGGSERYNGPVQTLVASGGGSPGEIVARQ